MWSCVCVCVYVELEPRGTACVINLVPSPSYNGEEQSDLLAAAQQGGWVVNMCRERLEIDDGELCV